MAGISRQRQFSLRANRWLVAPLAACAALLALCGQAAPLQAVAPASAPPGIPGSALASGPICRFGLNVGTKSIADFDVAQLRIGWYIDYGANPNAPRPGGATYTPVVNLAQVGETGYTSSPSIGPTLDATITGNPGAAWIIGNEPDRRIYQNDLKPAAYAHAYHDLYNAIKSKDPTARIFAGAIVQPTPVRLQYLDAVLQAYRTAYSDDMPVDGWAIHNFILNERSCKYYNDPNHRPADYDGPEPYNSAYVCWGADIPPGNDAPDGLVIRLSDVAKTGDIAFFKQQMINFRQWMYDHGYSEKPLYLSEYGILMPERLGFPPATVNKYMTDSFNFLLTQTDAKLGYPADSHRLVQRLSWYSTLDIGFNGSLFESTTSNPTSPPFRLSTMGNNYRSFITPVEATPQFALRRLNLTPGSPLISGGPVTFTLTAMVANAGNNQTPAPATVRFYDGDPAAGGIQIGADQAVTLSGCGALATAEVQWPNIAPSASGRQIFAQLTASGVDQKMVQPVFFATEQVDLPIIKRTP